MNTQTAAKRTQTVVTLLRMICGWICLMLGIIGIILPLLPGVPLLFAGLILLSSHYRWARQSLFWLKRRLRKLADRRHSSPKTISYPRRVL
jgi:uncharacterized membrane protein YbaN (DUF454 family)